MADSTDNHPAGTPGELMQRARSEAAACRAEGSDAAGAVLARGDHIVATGRTRRLETGDPVRYAVMDCISNAGRRTDQSELTLYVSGPVTWLDAGTVVQFSIGAVRVDKSIDDERLAFLKSNGVNTAVYAEGDDA